MHGGATNSEIDNMTIAKILNQNIPLIIRKYGNRLERVASIGKCVGRSNSGSTSAIDWAFNHGVSAIDLVDSGDFLNLGYYALVIVEALTHAGSKEKRNFAIVLCLLAFGKKAN